MADDAGTGARDDAAGPDRWPSVSVVIPVLQEERHLAAAVGRVLAQDYPGELEVVLAVGPSTDRTQQVADGLAAADPRVHVVPNPSGRTPDALNAGIAASGNEVVVRVDGHAELCDGYIRTAVAELERTGAVNVGGVMDAQGVTEFEKAVAAAMKSRLGVGNARFHVGGGAGPADTVYLGVFRRQALTAAGGYDPHFARAQDWELNHRLRRAGGLIWFTPDLTVTYRPRGSWKALATQYRNYGRWRRVVAARHEGTINLRYLAPPAMVVGTSAATAVGLTGLAAAASGSRAGRLARWALAVPAGYAAAVTVGGLAIGRGESARTRAYLPGVLATMHWAWGFGFLTSPKALREAPAKAVPAPRGADAAAQVADGAQVSPDAAGQEGRA